MSEGFRLRVKYEICGRLAYLSHLETIRSMERVIRRAELPFAITEGFSPHMKVAFGPALPVGAGSKGEYLDVRLTEYIEPGEALRKLHDAAPRNLVPMNCFYIEMGADAIDVAYPVSRWQAVFSHVEDIEMLRAAFDALLEVGYIEVIKKKGRNTKTKQVLFEGRLVADPEFAVEGDRVTMMFSTLQRSDGALRPDKFIAAALEGIEDAPRLVELTRLELAPTSS